MKRLLMLAALALSTVVAGAATVISIEGSSKVYTGSAAGDNAVAIQTDDVQQYGTFMLITSAGVVDVYVSLDGTNYATAPYSLTDLGAADSTPVLETVANRVYGFRGKFKAIRVLQKGGSSITSATLRAGDI